ncbi:hypothetical protein MP638_004657 [Amoeboaphelidium occidentale]|nr:hypothetical protein MP638_004657 [Amoeboaphelidium occidentale]
MSSHRRERSLSISLHQQPLLIVNEDKEEVIIVMPSRSSVLVRSLPNLKDEVETVDDKETKRHHKRIVSFSTEILSRDFHENSPPSRKRRQSILHGSFSSVRSLIRAKKSRKRIDAPVPVKSILKRDNNEDTLQIDDPNGVVDSCYSSQEVVPGPTAVKQEEVTSQMRSWASKKSIYIRKDKSSEELSKALTSVNLQD